MIISTREAYLGKRPLRQYKSNDLIIPLSLDNETVNPAIPSIDNNKITKNSDGWFFQYTYGIWYWAETNRAEAKKAVNNQFGIDENSGDLFYIPDLNAVIWFRDYIIPDQPEREVIAQKLIDVGMTKLLQGPIVV